MKRKIALLLAAVMTVAMVPATALAKTDNSVSRVVVLEKNKYTEIDKNAPYLDIDNDKGQVKEGDRFELILDGAEWKIPNLLTDPTAPIEPAKPTEVKPGAKPTAPATAKPAAMPTAPATAKPAAEPTMPANPKPTTEPSPTSPEYALWQEWITYETQKALWDSWTAYETQKALWDSWTTYENESAAWDKWTKYETDKAAYDLAKADYDKAKANYDAFKNNLDKDGYLKVGAVVVYDGNKIILLSTDTISVTIGEKRDNYRFPLLTKVTGDEATVTIDSIDSAVSPGTYRFARTTSASATVKISGTVNIPEDGENEIKPITISETVAGALEKNGEIKFRLYGDFKFDRSSVKKANIVSTVPSLKLQVVESSVTDDEFKLKVVSQSTTGAGKISISGIIVKDDNAKKGDKAEITVSGAGVEKKSLEAGTATAYGISFTVEDKKLPVFYSGRKYENDDTLKVTFKEDIADSWWNSRKTTLTFPDGVKVITADFKNMKYCTIKNVNIDGNKITFTADNNGTGKKEWKATFNLSISPDFSGDITCTLGGAAVAEDEKVTVAEAKRAVTFEVESKDVSIDYRNVTVGDIVIKEAYAGALKEDKDIMFDLDEISFEKGTKVKIEEGDIELEDLNEGDRAKGLLSLTVKKESHRTPAVIRLTNVQVYLNRNLPAGDYSLKVKGDAIIENYAKKNDIKEAEKFDTLDDLEKSGKASAIKDAWACFDISSYTLSSKYIKVVTAGRDRDDSSFTTKVVVTIGAYTMKAGDKDIALDVPAYISNSYTMLPVRAVADALSGNAATVLWDDATKTVTIVFGARIISMKIGSRTMNINGVAIQMNKAPEITNSRTFLPLRDLAYALGLTDTQIKWDDASKTATLN